MNDFSDMIAQFKERREKAKVQAMAASIDMSDAQGRLENAQNTVERIDDLLKQLSTGVLDEGIPAGSRSATSAAGPSKDGGASAFRGRSGKGLRPPETGNAEAETAPEVLSADEIKRRRLAKRQAKKDSVAAKAPPGTAVEQPTMRSPGTRARKRDGTIRNEILQALEQAAKDTSPVSRHDIVQRLTDTLGADQVNPSSIRTTLYALKREGLATSDNGMWMAT